MIGLEIWGLDKVGLMGLGDLKIWGLGDMEIGDWGISGFKN